MPTYDYLCNHCGYEFEVFQAMSDNPLDSCPQCSGHVRRLVSGGSGLIFKGSGFYLTDYKNKTSTPSSEKGKKKSTDKKSEKSSKEN